MVLHPGYLKGYFVHLMRYQYQKAWLDISKEYTYKTLTTIVYFAIFEF